MDATKYKGKIKGSRSYRRQESHSNAFKKGLNLSDGKILEALEMCELPSETKVKKPRNRKKNTSNPGGKHSEVNVSSTI
jgi:hypothetical protein